MKKHEKDSLIITAILGNETLFPERKIQPHNSHDGVQGSLAFFGDTVESGPCCAVGAAILYADLKPRVNNGFLKSSTKALADRYGVSLEYASGISYGFETGLVLEVYGDSEFQRGTQVGKAVFQAIYGGGV